METTLDRLPLGRPARITAIDWTLLDADEGRRLRELGLLDGIELTALHRGGLFWRDPLAVAIGRMRVAIRARHAAAIRVVLIDALAHDAGMNA
jgi:ferrous iron transport protein A